MSLGLGLGLPRSVFSKEYEGLFDTLGITSDVLSFSFKRLKVSYTGNCLRVRRDSDDNEQDIGFLSDGNIDQASLESFCNGTDGYVTKYYNQSSVGDDAYQTTATKQPKIVSSGSMDTDGMLFDGTDDYFDVDDYTAIQITNPPYSIYINSYVYDYNNSGYIFAKKSSGGSPSQYALLKNGIVPNQFIFYAPSIATTNGAGIVGVNTSISTWSGTGANELLFNLNTTEATDTQPTGSNQTYLTIGCRTNAIDNSSQALFFDGNIKTIIIFDTNEHSNYSNFVNGGI